MVISLIKDHRYPVKIRIVPDGTFNDFYLTLYQHIVPNGTVPEGQNTGRKQIKMIKKSRRDDILF